MKILQIQSISSFLTILNISIKAKVVSPSHWLYLAFMNNIVQNETSMQVVHMRQQCEMTGLV